MRDFRNIIFVLIIIVFALQMYVMKEDAKNELALEKVKPIVALSTFSLYDVAKNISGDTIELVMILPFGVDAHSFEPTPKLVAKIHKSDLLMYNGAGLEPWIEGFEFPNKAIDMSRSVTLLSLEEEENEEEHHHEHDSECSHNGVDPHYWLDIENMIKVTHIMRDEFIKIAPENEQLYKNNQQVYVNRLHALDDAYKQKLSTCQGDTIIVNHNAFSYLANRYGFHVESLSGLSPEAEPSAKNMIKLIKHVKEHNISTVFFESFVSDKAMKSIAKEAGVDVDVLQPLGNITADEAQKKLDYETVMRINLEKISRALKCR
ncbi:metal ABC transporter substrate-binding protein [bacterium]|nr:metal ABC transporter substrate-binding protein [bacterium]MBU1990068.1 metal ABC transporter substrate-binding protein [bacterium]